MGGFPGESAEAQLQRLTEELAHERSERQRLQAQLDAQLRRESESRERGDLLAERGRVLERSNKELLAFTAIASHDLQEPLRKMRTFVDRLRTEFAPTLEPEAQELLERVFQASLRMQALIEDLLSYAQVERSELTLAEVDLNGLVQEVLAELSVQIEKSEARVEVGALPRLQVQPIQFRQLFQNLLSNSLKFTRPGVPPLIHLHAHQWPGGCELVCEDNGVGFEPRHAERIFGMFQRLHSRSEFPGSGMGLAIVRRIAERHGGAVTAEGHPGRGSTFRIRLPALSREQ